MKSSQKRGFSTLAVIGCCLAGYVVLAFAFKSFVGPTAAKYHPVVEAPPAPVAVVAPQPTAAPPAAAAKSAATQSPIMQSPTAQFDLPSRFVVQRPPAPVPEPRAAKPKASTATAAWDDAAPKKPVKKQVARTTAPSDPWSGQQQQQQRTYQNSWGNNSWSFAGNGHSGSRPWF